MDTTPAAILEWFVEVVREAAEAAPSAVLLSTADNAPEIIPPGQVFAVVAPGQMRFQIEEQCPAQCIVEFQVRVRLFIRKPLDVPGSLQSILVGTNGIYEVAAKIVHHVLTTAPPAGNLRGQFAAEVSTPVEWMAPPEGQLSFVSLAIDFRADFDWALA